MAIKPADIAPYNCEIVVRLHVSWGIYDMQVTNTYDVTEYVSINHRSILRELVYRIAINGRVIRSNVPVSIEDVWL